MSEDCRKNKNLMNWCYQNLCVLRFCVKKTWKVVAVLRFLHGRSVPFCVFCCEFDARLAFFVFSGESFLLPVLCLFSTSGLNEFYSDFSWGVIFLAHGFWEGAVYRFTISIPETYPSDFPVVTFTQPVYNPYIDPETSTRLLIVFKIDLVLRHSRP